MAAKDLGKSTKKLALSALTEILGHRPTLTHWRETKREEAMFKLPVPDDGRTKICLEQKAGICVEFTASIMLSDKEVPVSGRCVFKKQEGPPVCHQPNSTYFELGDARVLYDFYTPSERDVFPIKGVPQT